MWQGALKVLFDILSLYMCMYYSLSVSLSHCIFLKFSLSLSLSLMWMLSRICKAWAHKLKYAHSFAAHTYMCERTRWEKTTTTTAHRYVIARRYRMVHFFLLISSYFLSIYVCTVYCVRYHAIYVYVKTNSES